MGLGLPEHSAMPAVYLSEFAPVAQWIEQRFPKPCAEVRFFSGALGRRPRKPKISDAFSGAPLRLGRLGECQVWIPFRFESFGAAHHPSGALWHAGCEIQLPTHFGGRLVAFHVVAL